MQERRRFAEKRRSVGEAEQAWDRALKRSLRDVRQADSDEMQWIGDIAPFEPGRDALGDPGDPFDEGNRSPPVRAVRATPQHRHLATARLSTAMIAGALIGSALGLVVSLLRRQERKLQE